MAHHLCRIQELLDLEAEATPPDEADPKSPEELAERLMAADLGSPNGASQLLGLLWMRP